MKIEFKPNPLSRLQLLEKISSDVTIVTGNARLSSSLVKSYDKWMSGMGHKAWPTPDIISWNAWLSRTFKDNYFVSDDRVKPIVINDSQERIVWEEIIKSSEEDSVLLQTAATARHAASSWKLVRHWDINLDAGYQHYNDDVQAFVAWSRRYREKLKKESWVSSSDLASSLIELFSSQILSVPKHIILTGFDELSVQQVQLLTLLEERGCAIEWAGNINHNQVVKCLAASHTREEIDWAARWARTLLEENKDNRIAIVVPDLRQVREIIFSTFGNIFRPGDISLSSCDVVKAFNISLGKPLSEYRFIETAFSLLRLSRVMDVEEMSIIIKSPYIMGWNDEKYKRSLLDLQIRQPGKLVVKLDYVRQCAGNQSRNYACGGLSTLLDKLTAYQQTLPSTAQPSEWAKLFSEMLQEAGFSCGRSLTSDEYQVAQAWNELLYEFAGLDNTCGLIQYPAALAYMTRIANERIFQPKTQDAPVQILGIMEAIGLEFDYMWIMGLHDEVWPPAPKPDPFIPFPLQRQHNLPHSSAEREFETIDKITQRLIASSREVIISYPSMNAVDILRPSPLLKNIQVIDVGGIKLWKDPVWKQLIFESSLLESVVDNFAAPVDGEVLRGGSQIIKLQSLCPFRAFAELRLGARPANQATIGMTAAERGSIIHKVLEYVWKDISSHASLMNLSEKSLNRLISKSVSKSLEHYISNTSVDIPKHFMGLEQNRLEGLIKEWMEIEKQRQAFTVLSTEKNVEIDISGIMIKLKLDRVDQLEQGGQLVIDYKTGSISPSQWFGNRPQEPQLPLYSMVMPDELSALSFAQLQAGSFGFKGIASEKGLVPGIKSFQQQKQTRQYESWEEMLSAWKGIVETLANEFRQGNAVVDPLEHPSACTYCSLTQFCRVNEMQDNSSYISEAEK